MKEVTNSIPCYVTKDYGMFKRLVGNRGIDLQRVARIKKSIEERYVKSPITVNKHYEVIDGQGRLAALKELGLPVYYVVDEEAGLDDCIRMNINTTQWNITDYVYSGRDRGIEDYTKLASLLDRYILKKKSSHGRGSVLTFSVPVFVIIAAAEGSISAGGARSKNTIQNGLFKFTEDYNTVIDQLDYVSSLHGHTSNHSSAAPVLLFAKRTEEIDEIRLRSQLISYKGNRDRLPAYSGVDDCVLVFEAAYNHQLGKKNRVDMRALYNRYREEYGGTAGKAWANTRGRK